MTGGRFFHRLLRSRVPGRLLLALLLWWRLPIRCWQNWRRTRACPDNPRRILLVHHLLLGDTLMLTPLLAALRARYPQAEITFTLPQAIAPLYAARPYGVEAVVFEPRRLSTLLNLVTRYVRRAPDVLIIPAENRYSLLAVALNASWVIAFEGDHPAWKNRWVDDLRPYPRVPAAWTDMVLSLCPQPPQMASATAQTPTSPDGETLAATSITATTTAATDSVTNSASSTVWAAPIFREHEFPLPAGLAFPVPAKKQYAVLHVGAGSQTRQWLPQRWLALAEALSADGLTVVWSAGPGEESWVAACDPRGQFHSYAGSLSLLQLAHLLADAALFVSPDTGVAHLVKITGCPSVTLFGPGSAEIYGPGYFWQNHPYAAITAEEMPCRDGRLLFEREHLAWVRHCCIPLAACPHCLPPAGTPRCMNAITVDAVLAVCRRLRRPFSLADLPMLSDLSDLSDHASAATSTPPV